MCVCRAGKTATCMGAVSDSTKPLTCVCAYARVFLSITMWYTMFASLIICGCMVREILGGGVSYAQCMLFLQVQGWPEPYIHTVCDQMYGELSVKTMQMYCT